MAVSGAGTYTFGFKAKNSQGTDSASALYGNRYLPCRERPDG